MSRFSYGIYKNTVISEENMIKEVLEKWADYLCLESTHGKIPLVIAGAGVSACDVKIISVRENEENQREIDATEYIEKGLPCLHEMVKKLKDEVMADSAWDNSELVSLKNQFQIMADSMENIDREWLGRIFTVFEKSKDKQIKKIWRSFCNWFFFSCMQGEDGKEYGALNVKTSKAAEEIVKLYDSVGALCLSANFDDFVKNALVGTKGSQRGIAVFERTQAEDYLKRNRRGTIAFEEKPYNRCVFHANGDVFWLSCSGEKGEGYCPNTRRRRPAFDGIMINSQDDLFCTICGSPLVPTMTMPGTYEKDYNTRTIIETIWKYLSTKISGIITVGISCNWDDILLKFILQLMSEMDIPLLDINHYSDRALDGKTQLGEIVVKRSYMEACALQADAAKGLHWVNEAVDEALRKKENIAENIDDTYINDLITQLEAHPYIKRLSKVSQLGLKSYWLEKSVKNERWEHSKEVAEIAEQMYKKMLENSKKTPLMYEKVLIYTAGLLHDCGHLPFSHLLEDVFEELSWCMQGEKDTFKHSHYTRWVIHRLYHDDTCQLKSILDSYGIDAEDVIRLIEGKYGLAYIDMLINSALDADKIAYVFTDAEKSNRNLALNKESFLEEFLKNAYITQEGLVALDGASAWYAMRLLDERKRMYDELYYDTRIRCFETLAKYIITTYFVQKYNNVEMIRKKLIPNAEAEVEDLGNCHILCAIDDLYDIIEDPNYQSVDLSASVGDNVKQSIERCMQIILNAKQVKEENVPDEIKILKEMCRQLLGKQVIVDENRKEWEDSLVYMPYHDSQLDRLTEKLSYEQMVSVRKKIMLNYPGTIVVDIYKTAKYFSPSALRASQKRLDGTECEQVTILVPKGSKEEWKTQGSRAEIPLSEYAEQNRIDRERKTVFNVFCIGKDATACEHAINMMKKEMENIRR